MFHTEYSKFGFNTSKSCSQAVPGVYKLDATRQPNPKKKNPNESSWRRRRHILKTDYDKVGCAAWIHVSR